MMGCDGVFDAGDMVMGLVSMVWEGGEGRG